MKVNSTHVNIRRMKKGSRQHVSDVDYNGAGLKGHSKTIPQCHTASTQLYLWEMHHIEVF